MADSMYISAAGAQQVLEAQAVHANNLANVNTRGFRADYEWFRSQDVFGEGHLTDAYPYVEDPGSDLSPGTVIQTQGELDIAVQGAGWIAVQNSEGQEGYTRVGDLQMDPNGALMNSSGHLILGNGGTIAIPPAEKIEIGSDGTISIRPLGQEAQALAQIDRIKLVNPPAAQMRKGEDGLFYLKDGSGATADASVKVIPNALENSNVNAVSELTHLIALARHFEIQIKMMQTQQETTTQSAQMLQTS